MNVHQIICVIISAVVVAEAALPQPPSRKALAKQALQNGDVNRSARLLEKYVYEDSSESVLADRLLLARLFLKLGQRGKAYREFIEVFAIDANHTVAVELFEESQEAIYPPKNYTVGVPLAPHELNYDRRQWGVHVFKSNDNQYIFEQNASVISLANSLSQADKISQFYEIISSRVFFESYWEKMPLLIRTGGAFENLLTWEEISQEYYGESLSHLLHTVYPPTIRLIKGAFYTGVRYPNDDFDPIWKGSDLRGMLESDNITLVLDHISTIFPGVASLALNLTSQFALPTHMNLYITTPQMAQTINPHTDLQSTFIIQLEGRKRWLMWRIEEDMLCIDGEKTVGAHAETQISLSELGPAMMDVVLHPGDVLFVPRGLVHATSTVVPELPDSPENRLLRAPSLHITAGSEIINGGSGPHFTRGALVGGTLFNATDDDNTFSTTKLWIDSRAKAIARLAKENPLVSRSVQRRRYEWKRAFRELMYAVVDDVLEDEELMTVIHTEYKRGLNRLSRLLIDIVAGSRRANVNLET